ncbi:carbohydrate ABC transporter permease [Geodermatophilus sabuli]|uniref:carbohydrate ABC transporter permease n=1 Tax=Geodermatophilus sabuli TaxID=1564158 RepID=UPI001796EEEB|nr:sugar ABC transporter permease [Geodermatophilus sabuli]MBB3085254.1 multiple sugar transport system permease protein [Geodermatophilus sabuli]
MSESRQAGDREARSPGRGTLRERESRTGLALISPTVVLVLVLVVLPILWTVVLAFQDLKLIRLRTSGLFGTPTFENFADVFGSPGFWDSLVTTLVYASGGTAASIGLGLVAALALRHGFRGRMLIRASLLLPYVAPVVAATFVWGVMLNPQFGIVNEVGTRLLGWDEPIAFLSERPTALLTVIFFEMWRSFPFAFLFITARLQAAPATLEEAARVDGATPTQVFRHIVWPQLLPTIAVLALLRFIWTFNNFDDIYLLTGGGAGTDVISVRVFEFLISRGDIGAASAQALVLSAVLMVLVTVYYRFAAKDEVA